MCKQYLSALQQMFVGRESLAVVALVRTARINVITKATV
jgi:hypothetical protein